MNPILLEIIQWTIAIMFISGVMIAIWFIIKNTGIGHLLSGIWDVVNRAAKDFGDQLSACSKDLMSSKCWIKWLFIGIPGAMFVSWILKNTLGRILRTKVDRWIEDSRGEGITEEEAGNMETEIDEAYSRWAAKNPEKAKNMSEDDELQIKKSSLYRRILRSFKKLLSKSNKSEEERQAAEESMDTEMQEMARQAAEQNPEGNDNDIDDATDGVDDELGDVDFF